MIIVIPILAIPDALYPSHDEALVLPLRGTFFKVGIFKSPQIGPAVSISGILDTLGYLLG